MITSEIKYPFNKSKLWTSFKHADYKSLRLRDPKWFDDYDIKMMMDSKVIAVENVHGSPFVILDSGLKIVRIET